MTSATRSKPGSQHYKEEETEESKVKDEESEVEDEEADLHSSLAAGCWLVCFGREISGRYQFSSSSGKFHEIGECFCHLVKGDFK